MVDLNDAVTVLRAKRQELVNQLEAVDRALAALAGVDTGAAVVEAPISEVAPPRAADELTSLEPAGVVPTKLRPKRILSDEHRQALNEGRRKARHSTNAAAGFARETIDPAPGLTPASGVNGQHPPRLVKRTS